MKLFIKYAKNLSVFLIMFLITLNGYFFVKTMILGNSLIKIEKEMKKLKIENSEIEKKVYSLNSLQNLQGIASSLGFVKNAELFYLESLKFTPPKTEHKLAQTAKIDRYE